MRIFRMMGFWVGLGFQSSGLGLRNFSIRALFCRGLMPE